MDGGAIRVLHVIQEMRTGGAESVVAALTRGALDAGHAVGIAAAPGDLDGALDPAVIRHPLPVLAGRPWHLPGALRDARRAAAFGPDIVHVHNPRMAGLAAAARLGRRPAGLVSVHGVPEHAWAVSVRLLRASRLPVVACGPGVAAALADHGAPAMTTIVNGVPPAPAPAEREAVLALARFPADTRLVVMVGRLSRVKNHRLALHALTRLDRRVRLLVVGEGDQREPLERLVDRLGLTGRVRFCGRRPGRPLMGAADVNCLTSTSEGMPLAALESMASGRPLVATAVRGLRELLAHERTALLVPSDDPTALADALQRVLDSPRLAAALAAAAVEEAERFSEAGMVEAYLRVYDTLRR